MGSALASSMCFLCFNTEEMYLLHWHRSINVRLILVSLSFFSPCSASLDVFPKEDKVVRIHAFFSMLWYTVFFFCELDEVTATYNSVNHNISQLGFTTNWRSSSLVFMKMKLRRASKNPTEFYICISSLERLNSWK